MNPGIVMGIHKSMTYTFKDSDEQIDITDARNKAWREKRSQRDSSSGVNKSNRNKRRH